MGGPDLWFNNQQVLLQSRARTGSGSNQVGLALRAGLRHDAKTFWKKAGSEEPAPQGIVTGSNLVSRGAAEVPGVGQHGRMKTFPNHVTEKRARQ
jgi:hypothetical protein